ncbi:MAG: efflux RND transporter periplasmic adaptor subunit [Phenylobacterium sp.]|uniref:efflux RND transporter periplasmic adaptor subunit n=1 Tax=Phenylobacterium sp. TaxID=1871053 RepID=UPI001A49E6BE|nr:efflux RND transporter periplasmic adaptor subunit [Phenylobacterium sp.]MBL8770268.1 efflux RND transporter periplasmic adaptor subunit [Phenylobacterium sp.]
MVRRHFFLVAALIVLGAMVVFATYKVLARSAGPGGPGGPGAAAQGMGGGGGPGGPGGRRGGGGFGGPTLVSVTSGQPRVFEDTIEVLGVAKGRQSVTLTAAATQLVDRVRFRDGQQVSRGAVLVELRDTEQSAGIAQAQARLVQAKRAYDRYKELNDKGFASKAALDQYEAAWRSAQADVNAAQARQNDRIIRAPFSGVVGLSDVAPGALVNPGAPIVTLDDISVVRVDFQVPERYLSQLREGQPLLATTDAFPGETIRGRIARLDTRVDERTRAITARAEFPNAGGRLKPGMMFRVGVSRGQRTSVSVPESAVSVQGDNAFVFAIRQRPAQGPRPAGAMVEQRPIVTGVRQQGYVEIREGLRAGEQVVADGLNKLQPGQPVRVGRSPGIGADPTQARPAAGRPAPPPEGARPAARPAA